MLVEDSNNEQLSYIDFLCLTHQVRFTHFAKTFVRRMLTVLPYTKQQIQATLMGESKKQDVTDSSSWTTW